MRFRFLIRRSLKRLWIFFLLLTGSLHAETLTISYEDLPHLISEKNDRIQAASQTVKAEEKRTGFLKRSFLPEVGMNAGVEHFKTRDLPQATEPFAGVELDLNFYRGGKDRLEEETRQAEVGIAKARGEEAFREELLAARALFWNLAFQQESIKVFKEISRANAQARSATSLLVGKGLTTGTDLLGFDLFRDQLKEKIVSSEYDLRILEIELKNRLGLAPDSSLQLSLPSLKAHDHSQIEAEKIPDTPPEVAALEKRAEVEKKRGEASSRWWQPELGAFGLYQLYTERDRELLDIVQRQDFAGGLQLNMKLFDGLQSKREAQSAFLRSQATQKLAEFREKSLRTEWKVGKEELAKLHRVLHDYEKLIGQGRNLLKKTLEDFSLGNRDALEVQSALDRLLALQQEGLKHRRDFELTQVKLLGLAGE